ncbi:MAG TPA: winged helix-turn-helix domain-containing protein, partial [Gallionella sp.]|nr:winged helix-turn-helix domain-containing protein [Gallionella sp.]
MAIPTYDKFIEPILRYLATKPSGALARDAHEAAAQALSISEADRQELLPSGTQPIYKNRSGWAHDRLKRAGLSSSPRRGYWQLTEQGLAFVASHAAPLSTEDVEQLAVGFMDVRLKPSASSESLASPSLIQPTPSTSIVASPDDRLGEAVSELRRSVAAELLEILGSV